MFERFTTDARQIVVQAQEEAIALGHPHIGTEHLLLSLINRPCAASSALADAGVDRQRAVRNITDAAPTDALDADALSTIGIDLNAVREKVEATFGPGALNSDPTDTRGRRGRHIPFTKPAKKSLELALREAVRLHSKEITDAHLLLGLLREGDGLGYRTIIAAGADPHALRAALERPAQAG